jgi:galactokinase/mevalonate kinase-like predicted kinase
MAATWDYLILTASNEIQAPAYLRQLELRADLGLLTGVRQTLVVADPGGRRVGSGGSTLACLLKVLSCEVDGNSGPSGDSETWYDRLRRLRILIIHAGGDSRGLPAYGPCGKILVPLPGPSDSALGTTLLDRQLPTYLSLPLGAEGQGQVVITAGDVLLRFDPHEVQWNYKGVNGLGCLARPEEASLHGVFCLAGNGHVRKFLQKPAVEVQARERAITAYGQSALDMGVFSFDAKTAVRLLKMSDVRADTSGTLNWSGPIGRGIDKFGLDFYQEIACAFGAETTLENYQSAARCGGSRWADADLGRIYEAIHDVPCHAQVVGHCEFLHFGTSRQIIESGQELVRSEAVFTSATPAALCMNTCFDGLGSVGNGSFWIEGCSISQRVSVVGENVLIGVDVDQPLELPAKACLDILPGRDRAGHPVTFVRCYGIDDTSSGGSELCGETLDWWAAHADGTGDGLWESPPSFVAPHPQVGEGNRNLWNARVFPAETDSAAYWKWLWLFHPQEATAEQWDAWRKADRYSFEEMATLADQEAFHRRRMRLHAEALQTALCGLFRHDSGFSAADLALVLANSPTPETWVANVLREARRREESQATEPVSEAFSFARTIHTLGSALRQHPNVGQIANHTGAARNWLVEALQSLDAETHDWLDRRGLGQSDNLDAENWACRAQSLAFDYLRRKIVTGGRGDEPLLRCALRSDEIAWGRAPARLDLAGGWSDTPPYTLENGGTVLNAAVLLNGQPPVQVYGRVIAEPAIRARSIDLGTHLDIQGWDELLECGSAEGVFSLVKAALIISGFTPLSGSNRNRPLREVLVGFGGGLEITTLAAIPKGSGLGTSSIMGAVLLAVINRMMGRSLTQDRLFYNVLRLEQELTTGGGWQDQIGGSIGGLKLVTTKAGLLPEAIIRYVPADILDPRLNGGQTLLYYTGVTRLAKNILQNVVGRYLDRDRQAIASLGQLAGLASHMAEAMGRKDIQQFGALVDTAWALNQQLDPQSTTPEIEQLLSRIGPCLYGAKLLGAGGGGFLLLVAKSKADADRVTRLLEDSPPNDRARFFDFQVSDSGLAISVC